MSCLPCRRRSRRGSCPASSCRTTTRRSSTPISAMTPPGGPAVSRDCRRHGGMGVSQARRAVGDGQRRRPHCRPPGRRIARHAVARCGAGSRSSAAAPVAALRASSRSAARHSAPPRRSWRAVPAATAWNNLHLAGDYVDTGLPATIEGAIRSGIAAADRISPTPQLGNWRRPDFRPRRRRSRQQPRTANARCHESGITANEEQHGRARRRARIRGWVSMPRSSARSPRCCPRSTRTAIGCSSSKPTRRSRPNTSCCSTISARSTRRIPSSSSASRAICARRRARMAAGRCSTAARSTSAPRSRLISR